MPALIIILKVILAVIALYRIYVLLKFRSSDTNVKFKFDLTSMIEVDAGIAFSILALLAVIDEKSYAMTIALLIISIAANMMHLFRTIVAGDKRILIGIHDYDLKEIKGMNASRITLHVFVKGGKKINVIVPLTTNDTISKMKYLK